jgi:hypothetical protein
MAGDPVSPGGFARAALVPSAMLFGIAWLTAGPSAQGLGEIAKRESARRQQVAAGKKYTNEDLSPALAGDPAAPMPAATGSAPAAPATGDGATPAGADGAADGTAPAEGSAEARALANAKMAREKRPESYWRDKAVAVRAAMAKTNARAESFKKRLASLEEQMQNGGGSSHAQEREVTLKSLQGAQDDVKSMQGEWDRLEARAKLENIPLEWLR